MASRETRNLGECVIDGLRVETATAFEKRILVTERAVMRTSARNNDRIRHEITMSLDQVAANRWNALQRSHRRLVALLRTTGFQIAQKMRKSMLTRSKEDRIGVRRRLIGQ